MSKKKTYPYQLLQLKNLPGERFKPIKGLEEYFSVSNKGRVKRHEYEVTYKNGAVYLKSEKIIKPEIRWSYNKYKNDWTPFLSVRVGVGYIYYNFAVARLVYSTFKKNFVYSDFTKVIFYGDGDSLNVSLNNLIPASVSDKQKRIKLLGRSPNPFHKLNAKELKQRHWNMVKFRLKKITQFNLEGKKIKTFNSIAEAHRETGTNATGISRNAKGYLRSSGGYMWKYSI